MKIKSLTLYTNQIQPQKQLYHKVLGFELVDNEKHQISFQIGDSKLIFKHKPNAKPYHFAFNIPSNQIENAKSWIQERIPILKDENNEIIDFPAWNAKAIYFYDADNNIVELIARKGLAHETSSFGTKEILSISEIGLVTENIKKVYDKLLFATQIPMYDGSFDRFLAAGNEYGLFIIINKNKKDWFPTNDKAFISDFELIAEINEGLFQIQYQNSELKIMKI